MAETFNGKCHCGAVTFTVRFDEAIETSRCNCSICQPTRFWKALVPAEAFTLDSGADALGTYEFGRRTIKHHYCMRCGEKLHGDVSMDGGALVAVSVPTLGMSPEQLAALPVTYQNGAEDDYEHPPQVTSYL
ncbi:GFA family protein [Brucella sp. JSBI001]|uniref:GFA family protein n=1 Tax=Brucella sp. JSBI001 TaxID=2886044 RepID=UPI002231307D|nr:GFA family protein [Brucella sp. JSBI001]UZD69387.1 GFA family protein [Brucella sp. JSBI001]